MERFNWTWGDTKKPTGERGIKINEKTVISYKPNGELITLIQGSAFKLEKDSHIYLTRQEIFDLAEELRKPDSLITGTGEETEK